jgi:hypothetical protein
VTESGLKNAGKKAVRIRFYLMPAEPSGYFGVEPIVKLYVGVVEHTPRSFINAKFNNRAEQPVLVANPAVEEQTESGKVMH